MDPAILLIIVFIVAPLIERLLKAGKQQPPQLPPQPRPRPEQPQRTDRLPGERSAEPPVVVARREEESAADMLPDDLWEILTGQKRMPQPPARMPEPEEAYSAEEDVEWEDVEAEEIIAEPPPPARWRSAELELPTPTPSDFKRPVPARAPPRVVSMEKLEFNSENRHAEFHDKLDRLSVARPTKRTRAKNYRFTNAEDVRRAIVLREILGPPKGLE